MKGNERHRQSNAKLLAQIDGDTMAQSAAGQMSTGYTRNSVASLNDNKVQSSFYPPASKDFMHINQQHIGQSFQPSPPNLSRHGHAQSMIENLKNITRKRSRVNFTQLRSKAKGKDEVDDLLHKGQGTDRSTDRKKRETSTSYSYFIS